MTHNLTIELASHQQKLLQMTMPEALDFAADQWGDRLALTPVEGGFLDYTWRALRDAVSRVRTGLEQAGIAPGTKVGLMVHNSDVFPVCWLALIEAGAVAVPLNPKYTTREVEFVLNDADATWLIATSVTIAQLNAALAIGPVPMSNVIYADDNDTRALTFRRLLTTVPTPRTHIAKPRDVVNIQFTSGTTGLPKGCLLTHEYWIEFGAYSSALFDEPQRLLADHPFYYMQNQAYFWMALAGGGALYLTNGLSRRKFMGWLTEHHIDFAWIDDFMLDGTQQPGDTALDLKKAPIAGIYGDTHRALEERFALQARDWYASTESGNGMFVPWERTDLVGVPTLGLAWPTRETKIIDQEGAELPVSKTGELCLRGTGMMLGYHNRPEVNAELFMPDGWFRTGDLVRKDEDGFHYFEGRIKDMVKRSGENISCAEVEQHIESMRQVDEVGVIPVPDRDRGEEVKAIVVVKPGHHLTADEIELWCSEGLAAFKIPRYVEFRDKLPHTASGKIAKADLREESAPTAGTVIDLRPAKTP